jgi:hypothetical protein
MQCSPPFALGAFAYRPEDLPDAIDLDALGPAAAREVATLRDGRMLDYDLSPPPCPTSKLCQSWFVVVSEMVASRDGFASFLVNTSIIAVYTTFIFAVARLMRAVLSGLSFRIFVEDLAYADDLLDLVNAIRAAQAEKQLNVEEELFWELINIYRNTETLSVWSAPVNVRGADGRLFKGEAARGVVMPEVFAHLRHRGLREGATCA